MEVEWIFCRTEQTQHMHPRRFEVVEVPVPFQPDPFPVINVLGQDSNCASGRG